MLEEKDEQKEYCLYYRNGACTIKRCRWQKTKDNKQVCAFSGRLGKMEIKR